MKLQFLTRRPGAFWIGPAITGIAFGRLLSIGLVWGWDGWDPWSPLPHARRRVTPEDGAACYTVGWLGFNLYLLDTDVSYRMRAAELTLDRTRLVVWE